MKPIPKLVLTIEMTDDGQIVYEATRALGVCSDPLEDWLLLGMLTFVQNHILNTPKETPCDPT